MKKLLMILPLALILCFMVGCQDKEALAELEGVKAQAQVEEQNKKLIRQYYIELDNIKIEELDKFVDKFIPPDFILHLPGGVDISGKEELKGYYAGSRILMLHILLMMLLPRETRLHLERLLKELTKESLWVFSQPKMI